MQTSPCFPFPMCRSINIYRNTWDIQKEVFSLKFQKHSQMVVHFHQDRILEHTELEIDLNFSKVSRWGIYELNCTKKFVCYESLLLTYIFSIHIKLFWRYRDSKNCSEMNGQLVSTQHSIHSFQYRSNPYTKFSRPQSSEDILIIRIHFRRLTNKWTHRSEQKVWCI